MSTRRITAGLAALLATASHSATAQTGEARTGATEARVPVGRASLFTRVIGFGRPAIVLHGGPDFDHGYLLPELDQLADAYRLIYYDQRGRGKSAEQVRPEDVTLASDVDDLDRVRQHFRLRAPVLLGHSWGTVLALEYALRHPTRVSHLVLMNPAPASAPQVAVLRKSYLAKLGSDMDRQREIMASTAYKEGDPDAVTARYRIHFKPALRRLADYEKLMARMSAGFHSQGNDGIVKAWAVEDRLYRDTWQVPGYDLLPRLRRLRVPTLVLVGEHDFIPTEIATQIARAIPNATLVTIKDCGHFAYLECGTEVRNALNDFFLRTRAPSLSAADSTLVGRILLAEDRRDSTDGALAQGSRHSDPRVRLLAGRARGRIRDPRFSTRDSFAVSRASIAWPEPAWRLRYRALAGRRGECSVLRNALGDSAWPVRLHAADLVTPQCGMDDSLASVLRQWIAALPADASRRATGGVSWHAAAHALVALARVRPEEARPRARTLATHREWPVRAYAARAAAELSDTLILRSLARDANDNVKEVAIESLSKLTGHADDEIFLAALLAEGAQAVRAAAIALKGSPRADVAAAANAAFERWVARANASERDVRIALLEAAGRPASDDRPPAIRVELPPQAVPLALGADVRLRVTMAPSSGGGSFVVRLRGDVAPMMAARILALARAGYYDGLSWHRVEHDFVIQGGSPGANEYVGLAQYLRDELGTVPHVRGTVGMSTRGHDTGDAQWFINLKDNLRLNRDYTVFAEVIEGIDVVDAILEGDVMAKVTVEK